MCRLQHALLYFFIRASWMWNVSICLAIYSQITYGKLRFTYTELSLIIWPLNTLVELIPTMSGVMYGDCSTGFMVIGAAFLNNAYDLHDHTEAYEVYSTAMDYSMFTFFGPLIICISTMIVFTVRLYLVVIPRMREQHAERAIKCIQNATMYPLVTTLAWIPNLCVFLVIYYYIRTERLQFEESGSKDKFRTLQHWDIATTIWGLGAGTLLAAGFFYKCKEPVQLWKAALGMKEKDDLVHFANHADTDTDGRESTAVDFEDDDEFGETMRSTMASIRNSRASVSTSKKGAKKSNVKSKTNTINDLNEEKDDDLIM